jgi:rhodanese-related sulfurtransferase
MPRPDSWSLRPRRSSDADDDIVCDATTRVDVMFGNQVPTVQPSEVAGRVADGWMLLDVRTEDEWADGRIAGSVHIPMDQLMQRLNEVDNRIVCVCAVGARSARVAEFLNAQGREAVNLDGGINAWANSGLPVEG